MAQSHQEQQTECHLLEVNQYHKEQQTECHLLEVNQSAEQETECYLLEMNQSTDRCQAACGWYVSLLQKVIPQVVRESSTVQIR